MNTCPQKNSPEYVVLEKEYGEEKAILLYHMNGGELPTLQQADNIVNAKAKIVQALSNPKAQQLYTKFYKSNPDKFYTELLQLGSTKQQIDILRDINRRIPPQSAIDMMTNWAVEMSYTVEINTAKDNADDVRGEMVFDDFEEAKKDYERRKQNPQPTQHYSNLTVPGGTNYTENEIATPGIVPSIKGHAQFSTENGIGWFRSDDKVDNRKYGSKILDEDYPPYMEGNMEQTITDKGTPTKTRRILEVQSDLFQKGRDKGDLTKIPRIESGNLITNLEDIPFGDKPIPEFIDDLNSKQYKQNQFLQLLNKDGNWIPFFIKSIVQDSAKKGYEKVLFPTGDTASKVEGHETLEQFKKHKEDRIAELQKKKKEDSEIVKLETDTDEGQHLERTFNSREEATDFQNRNSGWEVVGEEVGYQTRASESKIKFDIDNEIKQLQEELKRVETEGFAALKPIYDFYENRVYNSLKKIYGKDKVERIKDEYGNEWYQIGIEQKRDTATTFTSGNQQGLTSAKFEGLSQSGPIQYTGKDTMTEWGDVRDTQGRNYSDTPLQDWKKEDMTGKSILEITAKEREYKAKGYKTKWLTDTGFHYQMSENKNYQLLNLNNVKYELQNRVNGRLLQKGRDGKVQNALSLIRGIEIPGEESTKLRQETIWKKYRDAGLEYKGELGERWEGGNESDVHIGKDGRIIKLRYSLRGTQPMQEFLEETLVHNYLFPQTAYELLGFVYQNDKVLPVIAQDKIVDDGSYNIEAIENLLKFYKFEKEATGKYYSRELGLFIGDIYPRNVLFREGIPYFIDPRVVVGGGLKYPIVDDRYRKDNVDKKLDKKVEKFLKSLGVHVQRLKDEGQNFAAMVDTINGIISVVEGRAGIETLGHEATHMFLDLLPEDSKLLKDILDQVEATDQYDGVYEQYSKLPEYILPDGSANKVKIAKEAAAHVIDDIIVQRYKDKKALKWWEKLWRYIQNMFRGKSLDAFSIVAEDILTGSTRKLSKEKLAAIKEAHDKGEIYYELSDRDKAYIKGIQGMATVAQKKAIDDLVLNPQVILDRSKDPLTGIRKHEYRNKKTKEEYTSTTFLINGKPFQKSEQYVANKEWGNDFDSIMQAIALGKDPSEIEGMERLTPEQVEEAYKVLSEYYNEIAGPGDIVLTQVVVYDHATKTAGSIDLLVIHPDGSRDIIDLKTLRKDRPYTGTGLKPGEGSVFDEPLNRKQKNAIQVATYRRMLGVMGYPNSKISAIYIKLDIEGKEVDQVLQGFEKGERVQFTETSWDTYAQKIVPTEVVTDKTEPEPLYTEEEMTPDNEGTKIDTEVPEEVIQKLDDTLTDIQNIYENRINYLRAQKIVDKSTIGKLGTVLYLISQDRDVNNQIRAYGRFLTYAQREVDEWIDHIGNRENMDNDYFNYIDNVMKYMKSYRGLPWVRQGTNAGQQSMVQKLEDSLDTLGKTISVGAFNYIKEKVKETYPNLQAGDVESLLKIQQDISKSALLGSDIAGSRDPLLAALDITVKKALDEVARARTKMRDDLTDAANEFAKVNGPITKKSFDFMYNGKKLLGRISDKYYEIKQQVMSTQYDENGELMKYRIGAKKPEDIEYNKNLYYIKQTIREFMDPEGEYHEYTPEFIAARKKVMRLQKGKYFDKWVKRRDVSDAEYAEFRREYMTYNPYYKMLTLKGVPTGILERVNDDRAWFPNKEYIQVREETESGVDMVNPRYRKLMNPTNELEKAQKKVYELYMDTMSEYAEKMGPEAQKWLMEGNRIAMMGSWVQKAQDEGILKAAGKVITNGFTPTIYSETTVTDETGVTMQSIPKLYMGGLRNQQKVVQLDNKILDLTTQYQQGKIDKKSYNAQMKDLKYQLVKEKSRPEAEDLEYDVFKQLMAYADMAENYIKLSEIEGTVKAYERMISGDIKNVEEIDGKSHVREGRKYYDVSGKGLPITGVGTNEPAPKGDPNTVKRVRNYLSQVFYNDPNMTKDMMDVMVKRVMNYTSLISVGLNLFGNINNYVLGKVNDLVDASSGKFYDRSAYMRAQKQFNTSLIPGIVAKQTITQGPYKKKVYGSKEEALIDKYRVVREQKSGEEKADWFKDIPIIGKLPYGGAQLGEYSSQGVPGLAILMSTDEKKHGIRTMKDSKTGETVSVADAHDFIDGKLVLREGFTESADELFQTTNYIFEVNKNIHGSYAQEDAMGIIKEWGLLGKMVAQFHKHIMPALRSRFAKNYTHATLGEYEGRYVSILEFLKDLQNYTGTWNRVMMSWKNLTPLQKKNFLQTGAEMVMVMTALATYTIVSGIAKGLDPDEDPTLKKMANFLSYQSSRLYSEGIAFTFTPPGAVQMYQYIRNPMAISSIAKNFAQALLSTSEWPLQVSEIGGYQLKDAYYQRGPFKGQLKAVRQWKRVVPILNNVDKWSSFDQLGHFSLIGS